MLTSALKRVDVAVQDLIKSSTNGKLKVGGDYVYSLKNNGVGLGAVNKKVPKADIAKTAAIGKLIGSGKIKVKPIIKFEPRGSRGRTGSRGWDPSHPL